MMGETRPAGGCQTLRTGGERAERAIGNEAPLTSPGTPIMAVNARPDGSYM